MTQYVLASTSSTEHEIRLIKYNYSQLTQKLF